jgi:hypothetical protein
MANMKKFEVAVEKMQNVRGWVEVEAANENEALAKVEARMNDKHNPLLTTEATWDDPEYIDWSFKLTGDVEEA